MKRLKILLALLAFSTVGTGVYCAWLVRENGQLKKAVGQAIETQPLASADQVPPAKGPVQKGGGEASPPPADGTPAEKEPPQAPKPSAAPAPPAPPANPQKLVDEGRVLVTRGKRAEALVKFDEAVAADVNFAPAHHHRGSVLIALGRKKEGEEAQKKARQLLVAAAKK